MSNSKRRNGVIRLTKVKYGTGYTAEYNGDPSNADGWRETNRHTTGNYRSTGTREEWRREARARGVTLWENRPAKYQNAGERRRLAAAS